MILQAICLLCCCGFPLQHVTAEYYNTTWDSFEWKITVKRQKQDGITLEGLHGELMPLDEVKIPGASCGKPRKVKKPRKTNIPRPFIMRCKCNLDSSTFVSKPMSCVENSYVKQGSQFTSGSWRWSAGWKWDSTDDALIVLDNKRDYGITIGFNATTTEYQSCSVVSLSYWTDNMKWIEKSSFLTDSKPVMFKLHHMWHISWIVMKMKAEVKESLKGKILKFLIECEKPGPPKDEDEELEITSWLLVKVTGQLNFSSNYWEASQNNTANTAALTHTNNQHVLLVALLVPLSFILLMVGVLVAVCYVRRTGCFVERESLHRVAVLDDDIVQTKLITNHADESVV